MISVKSLLKKESRPEPFEVTLGEPALRREGSDVTFLTVGATMYRALEAADQLQEKYGISAEVIDARTLVPFDYDMVIESVKKNRQSYCCR